MSKGNCLNAFAERFFAKVRERELSNKPKEKGFPDWLRQLLRTVGVFIIAPLITLLVLWIIELSFTDHSIDALHNVLIRTDVIFLAFSLALTVILEWTITADDGMGPTWFIVLEGLLGIVSVIIYAVEEVLKKLGEILIDNPKTIDLHSNALMVNRELIHIILLLAVILVAIIGYFRRSYRARNVPTA